MRYKRRDRAFEQKCCAIVDSRKVVTVTITEDGDNLFVAGHDNDVFCEIGESVKQRASHVEPNSPVLRWLFHFIRRRCSDTSRLAAFTRRWSCLWRVNTTPVGGPILRLHDVYDWCGCKDNPVATWRNRENAIEAEVRFLNQFFLGEEKS